MSTEVTYIKGSALADMPVTWLDSDGDPVDMSTTYSSFSLKVGTRGAAAVFTKTTGLTGTTTGLNVAWATSGELISLARGSYTMQFTAVRTADSKPRRLQGRLNVVDSIT